MPKLWSGGRDFTGLGDGAALLALLAALLGLALVKRSAISSYAASEREAPMAWGRPGLDGTLANGVEQELSMSSSIACGRLRLCFFLEDVVLPPLLPISPTHHAP